MRIVNAADLRYHEGARNHSYRQPVQHGASNGACIFCTIKLSRASLKMQHIRTDFQTRTHLQEGKYEKTMEKGGST